MIDLIEIILGTLLCLACLSIAWFTVITGISPMPSSAKACSAILKASEQDCSQGTVIDLGCAWGTLVFALARKYPGRRIVGYELSWLPWIYARLYKMMFGFDQVQILRENFLEVDLPEPSLMVCYLYPEGMENLQAKLSQLECNHILLISNTFALPGTEPIQTIQLDDLYNSPVYLYRLNNQP